MRRHAWAPVLVAGLVGALACSRAETPPKPTSDAAERSATPPKPANTSAPEQDPAALAYLDGAALELVYDTTSVAELARSLPRPSRDSSPLVGVFAHVVDALLGDPRERLAAVGLRADAPIALSVRVLDGRVGSVRKLLGELDSEASAGGAGEVGVAAAPELIAKLSSEARSLGVHLRGTVPIAEGDGAQARLLAALAGLTITDQDSGVWADACASLTGVALCSARPRLLLWARPESEERLRVDAVYFFHDGAAPADLARALARADAWPSRSEAPRFDVARFDPARFDAASLRLRLHAEPTLALLEAEALADAAVEFADPERAFDYHDYLDREQSLRDLLPDSRVFDGIELALAYDPTDDRMDIELGWLEKARASTPIASLFEPIVEPGTLPVLHGDCELAQACVRFAGISSVLRFVPLAQGPFADSTGAARILRQAGERGTIMLALASWPNLLGTAGLMADDDAGLLGKARVSLLRDTHGFGLIVLELGDSEAGSLGEQYVGYLRLGPQALAAIHPAATLLGASLRPIEIAGVDAAVERGSVESMSLYWIDESKRRGGLGGWLAVADSDARIDWLLDTPREPSEAAAIDPLWFIHVAKLGPIAARERVAYSDDPPVRAWLDGRSFRLSGYFRVSGPTLVIELGPTN